MRQYGACGLVAGLVNQDQCAQYPRLLKRRHGQGLLQHQLDMADGERE